MGETVVLRRIREQLHAPSDIPLWVYCGSSSFAFVVAIGSLAHTVGNLTLLCDERRLTVKKTPVTMVESAA